MAINVSNNLLVAALYLAAFFYTYFKELWYWRTQYFIYLVVLISVTLGNYLAFFFIPKKQETSLAYCYICRDARPSGGIHCPSCKVCVGNFKEHSRILGVCVRKEQAYVHLVLMVLLYITHVSLGIFQWIHLLDNVKTNVKHKSGLLAVLLGSLACLSGLAICFPPRLHPNFIGKPISIFLCLWVGIASYGRYSVICYTLTAILLGLLPFHTASMIPLVKEIVFLISTQFKMSSK